MATLFNQGRTEVGELPPLLHDNIAEWAATRRVEPTTMESSKIYRRHRNTFTEVNIPWWSLQAKTSTARFPNMLIALGKSGADVSWKLSHPLEKHEGRKLSSSTKGNRTTITVTVAWLLWLFQLSENGASLFQLQATTGNCSKFHFRVSCLVLFFCCLLVASCHFFVSRIPDLEEVGFICSRVSKLLSKYAGCGYKAKKPSLVDSSLLFLYHLPFNLLVRQCMSVI